MKQQINTKKNSAIFSECGKYRYVLTRRFDPNNTFVCNFIMLNPSTATAEVNDSTVTRCCNYAQRWGYGALIVTNLFGFRATDPKEMKAASDPIGVHNMLYIDWAAIKSDLIVCAWGTHGEFMGQGQKVIDDLVNPHYLQLTKHGHPKHPLYCRGDLKPIPFKGDS